MIINKELLAIIEKCIYNEKFVKMIISNPFNKNEKYSKIIVEKRLISNKVSFQIIYYYDTKVKHENYIDIPILLNVITNNLFNGYKQIQINHDNYTEHIIINKNGNYKVSQKRTNKEIKMHEGHNNPKNYILKDGDIIPWLVKLGISQENGKILAPMQKKFRQINKFLELIENLNQYIPENANILDIGCGKSYLSFAMYYFLNIINNKNVRITGIDIKKDVVEFCNQLAHECSYHNLHFKNQDISNYRAEEKIHMIISLHACDTATDYAIFTGIKNDAKVIVSVPCCQHEIFSQVQNKSLNQMLKHGILKERFSSLLTDTIRGSILEAYGYKTKIIEFIETEHTPKNICIMGIKKDLETQKEKLLLELQELMSTFHVKPTLYSLITNLK